MKTRKFLIPLLVLIVLSIGSMFCSLTQSHNATPPPTPTKATMAAKIETIEANQPTPVLPTNTAKPIPTPSPTSVPATTPPPTVPSFGAWSASSLNTEAVYALAITQNDKDVTTLFAGGEGKVWKTNDEGNTWTSSVLSEGKVIALAVSPNFTTDQTVFAVLGGSGLYKSINNGDTWSQISDNNTIASLAISQDYANDHTIFIGGVGEPSPGVFRSQDGGDSWASVFVGINNVFVSSLATSPNYANDHKVWAGANGWIYQSNDSGDKWGTGLGGAQCLFGTIQSIVFSPNYEVDGMAFTASEGDVFVHNGTWKCPEIQLPSAIQSLVISPEYAKDHFLFAGTSDNGVLVSSNKGNVWMSINNGLENLNVHSLSIAPSTTHTLFAATDAGVFKNNWSINPQNVEESQSQWRTYVTRLVNPNAITVDRQGNIWVGTYKGGVLQFDGSHWIIYTTDDGLTNNLVYSIVIDDAGIKWFGTWQGLSSFDGNEWMSYLNHQYIRAMAIDRDGHMWLGATPDVVEFYEGSILSTREGHSQINTIAIDREERKWVGTQDQGLQVLPWVNNPSCDHFGDILKILFDEGGNMWIGTEDGIYKLSGEECIHYTINDGLVGNTVYSIVQDQFSHMWFGTTSGVSEFDGSRWINYTTTDGLIDNNVYAVAIDNTGNLWFGTRIGISVFTP